MSEPLLRRLFAEWLGTALLVAVVVGSGIMGERLSGGNAAVALLGNTAATAAILVVLITTLGPISGAHFNPVVSAVVALRQELPWREAGAYAVVQIIGGMCGTLLAHLMFDLPLMQIASHARAGLAQGLSESVATFALVLTILGTIRSNPRATPAAVALVITAGYWFTASTSFANPAVTLARALTDTFSGIAPAGAPGFIAGQFAGALLAWLVAERVLGWRAAEQPSLTPG